MAEMPEAYRPVYEQMLEEARCWQWRTMLIEQRIEEELWRVQNLTAHELLVEADKWCDRGELDFAESLLQRAELEIIQEAQS